MNRGQLREDFLAILKRRDITTAQANAYLERGLGRATRLLRLPSMERSATYDMEEVTDPEVPGDFLQLIALTWNDLYELRRVNLHEILVNSASTGDPTVFSRRGGEFIIKPQPTEGTLRIDYFGTFEELEDDADSNELSEQAPEAIIYGALCYASDTYMDDRAGTFESRFQQIITDLMDQKFSDEMTNAVVGFAHGYGDD